MMIYHTLGLGTGMPLGLFKKVGKYRGIGGSGGTAPSGRSRGSALWGVPRGQSPLVARAFSQSELPRKPPIDTHGHYTYNTCTDKEEKKKKKKREKKKSGTSEKSEFRQKSGKRHPWWVRFTAKFFQHLPIWTSEFSLCWKITIRPEKLNLYLAQREQNWDFSIER